jgi:calcineurin-like phosphoesterase family protein
MFRAFYSDPHLGHKQIVAYCERPFAGLGEMHEAFIERYNAVVGVDDWVLWLGDCFLYTSELEARAMLARFNGHKGLVIGNHDKSKVWMAGLGFVFVVDQLTMKIGKRKVLVCHYPYAQTKRRNGEVDLRYPERRPQRIKGQVLLHGHTHTPKRRDGSMIHLGVDAWNYGPAPFEEVEKLVAEV